MATKQSHKIAATLISAAIIATCGSVIRTQRKHGEILAELLTNMTSVTATVAALKTNQHGNNDRIDALTILSFYRTDPWSGKMQVAFCDKFAERLSKNGVDVVGGWHEAVRDIQKEYEENIVPESVERLLKRGQRPSE